MRVGDENWSMKERRKLQRRTSDAQNGELGATRTPTTSQARLKAATHTERANKFISGTNNSKTGTSSPQP